MHIMNKFKMKILSLFFVVSLLSACTVQTQELNATIPSVDGAASYVIGPGDMLQIFVWGNPELSVGVPVRPDGRITTPLVEDVVASGKTPSQLARVMETRLGKYIKKPVVTITVTTFVGRASQQIRVVGQVGSQSNIPFQQDITLLDVIISVNGLTEFAAGNNATIARIVDDKIVQFNVRLDDLANEGDMSANVKMEPGDVLFVPESWF